MGRRFLPRLLFLWTALLICILGIGRPARAGQAHTEKRRSQVASKVLYAQDNGSWGMVTDLYMTQLSAQERQAYAALAAADLKKGQAYYYPGVSFTVSDQVAKDASQLKKREEIQKLFALGERALYAFRLDHMDRVYWMFDCDIDVNWATSSLGNGQSLVEVQYLAFTPIAYYGGALSEDEKVQSALREMAMAIRGERVNASRSQTVLAIVSSLAKRASYGGGKAAHTPAGILLSGHGRMGNCEGYARAFFCLCKRLGIPVVYVESKTHAFAFVQMENGAWYGVDPCWADVGNETDSRWILYGSAAARANDASQSHVAYLSRYGARFIALTIAGESYGF